MTEPKCLRCGAECTEVEEVHNPWYHYAGPIKGHTTVFRCGSYSYKKVGGKRANLSSQSDKCKIAVLEKLVEKLEGRLALFEKGAGGADGN